MVLKWPERGNSEGIPVSTGRQKLRLQSRHAEGRRHFSDAEKAAEACRGSGFQRPIPAAASSREWF
ncbi:hypothetical protein RCCGE510_02131 [Rhizobium sp. CCGE 510]|nr:hypothetical protein RCCGE510_02131 [Rhizobium sp. CCGE 510]